LLFNELCWLFVIKVGSMNTNIISTEGKHTRRVGVVGYGHLGINILGY
jgi:hypothetical protein